MRNKRDILFALINVMEKMYVLVFLFSIFFAQAQTVYSLTGYGNYPDGTKLYFERLNENKKIKTDTLIFENKMVRQVFNSKEALFGLISIENEKGLLDIIIDNSCKIYFKKDSIWASRIIRSMATNEMQKFKKEYWEENIMEAQELLQKSFEAKSKNDSVLAAKFYKEYNKIIDQNGEYAKMYAKINPMSLWKLKLINDLWDDLSETNKKFFYSLIRKSNLSHSFKDKMLSRYQKELSMTKGMKVPNMVFKSINGNSINIKDFKSQYLLLNFWGTWCGPCLNELPFLKNVREKYSPEKLEIISIALERKSNFDKYFQFIRKYSMDWIHVLEEENVNENNNSLNKSMGIYNYPTNILIDLSKLEYIKRTKTAEGLLEIDKYLESN